MKLTVVIPVFNEERTIAILLERVLAVPVVGEVVVVDDGSSDKTVIIVEQFVQASSGSDRAMPGTYPAAGVEAATRTLTDRPPVVLVRHPKNRGKGAAIRTGLAKITGDVVVIQDGDLEYDPKDFEPMLRLVEEGAPVVYGSRVLGNNKFSYLRFYFGGRLLSVMSNLLYGLHITDEPTCYKMARRDVMDRLELQCERFEFCPEMTAKVARLGLPIREIPISYAPRSLAEGKKIGWWDGVEALATLARYRFWQPKK